MRRRTVLRGGTVADGSGAPEYLSDVAVAGDRIIEIGDIVPLAGDVVIDCIDRMVLPGLIDAHSHAEAAVFDPEVALALLRQGVTTVITGQDGVSFAPGDGRYATDYFAALNGSHPSYAGGGVGALLAGYDGRVPVNVGYLVPHGTVRHEAMGDADRAATSAELNKMVELISAGLTAGALGLSTGLDYAPGYFADTRELVELSRPVAAAAAIYVSHMRGGYEDNLAAGIAEVAEIALATGVSAHVSHLHGPAALVLEQVDRAAAHGVDLSFDAYPYRRGCSLLAMPMLPPWLLRLGVGVAAQQLADPAVRAEIRQNWLPVMVSRPDMGAGWADGITLAGVRADEYRWAEGFTVAAAAARAGLDAGEFGLLVLGDSGLAVSAVLAVPQQRPIDELAQIFCHPAHVGSSDGIYLGGRPHPRGWGTFARYLGRHTRERGDYTWGRAALHLAGRTAARHCLGDRGRIAVGFAADVIVVDPAVVIDTADYTCPRSPALGIEDVLVNGVAVLLGGALTGLPAGRGLRRSAPVARLRTERTAG